MSSTQIFELRGEPDRYPGFLQIYSTEHEPWKEDIATRTLEAGSSPFGESYKPLPLMFNNEGKKKNTAGDICLSMRPFIIFSEKAREALADMLAPSGEFLEIVAPVSGFVGYRVLKQCTDVVNLELSKHTRYENGAIVVRKAVMYESKVQGMDIFLVPNSIPNVFVSSAFKDAVVKAKLKGFDWSREVPLTLLP